ncbi:MAG: hypothetical protein SF162_09285 [bacterium]|nr:hypothetical protein [bacterium]
MTEEGNPVKRTRILFLFTLLIIGALFIASASLPQTVYAQVQDTDGDGGDQNIDRCPNEPGPRENGFCPLPAPGDNRPADDRDGDGVADFVDACPDQPGTGFTQGCPIPTPVPPTPVIVSLPPNLPDLVTLYTCAIRNVTDRPIPIVADPSRTGELDTYVGPGALSDPADFGGQTGELAPGAIMEAELLVHNYPFYNPTVLDDALYGDSPFVLSSFYQTEAGYVLTTFLPQVEEAGMEPCPQRDANANAGRLWRSPTLTPPQPQGDLIVVDFDPTLFQCRITNESAFAYSFVTDPSMPGQLALSNDGQTNTPALPHHFGGVTGEFAAGATIPALYRVSGYPFWFDRIEDNNPAGVIPFSFWVTAQGYVLDLGGPTSQITGSLTCPEVQYGARGTRPAAGPAIENDLCYIVNYGALPLHIVESPWLPGQLTTDSLADALVVTPASDYGAVTDTLQPLDVRASDGIYLHVTFNYDMVGDDLGGVVTYPNLWHTPAGFALAESPRVKPAGQACDTVPFFEN